MWITGYSSWDLSHLLHLVHGVYLLILCWECSVLLCSILIVIANKSVKHTHLWSLIQYEHKYLVHMKTYLVFLHTLSIKKTFSSYDYPMTFPSRRNNWILNVIYPTKCFIPAGSHTPSCCCCVMCLSVVNHLCSLLSALCSIMPVCLGWVGGSPRTGGGQAGEWNGTNTFLQLLIHLLAFNAVFSEDLVFSSPPDSKLKGGCEEANNLIIY